MPIGDMMEVSEHRSGMTLSGLPTPMTPEDMGRRDIAPPAPLEMITRPELCGAGAAVVVLAVAVELAPSVALWLGMSPLP